MASSEAFLFLVERLEEKESSQISLSLSVPG